MGGFRSRSESARKGNPRRHTGRSTGYEMKRPQRRQEKPRDAGIGDPARDAAFEVLRAVTEKEAFGNLELPKVLRRRKISGLDAKFATELTYGTLRASGLLDAVISKAAGRPVSKIDSVALDTLRLGTYQLLRTRVEPHAAVHTSVEIAKANGAGKASGFVNGVLRTISRTKADKWVERVAPGKSIKDVALRHNHPEWIAKAFQQALKEQGAEDELEAALAADDERPIVHLAARPGQISAEELALITGGEHGRWSDYAVYLEEGAPGEIDAVAQGLASVQDEGSQLIALAMLETPLLRHDAGRWLDMCAGPGGKTAFIASWGQSERATVDAVEITPHRADLVAATCKGLPVKVHTGDARQLDQLSRLNLPAEGFDRILVDAPCTGLGALRRRPEARWRKTAKDVPQLAALQRELLRAAVDHVAPGGVVVYSTCSPHPTETTDVVRSIAADTGMTIVDLGAETPSLAKIAKNGGAAGPFIQLWPHRHGTDAMFIAALRRPLASTQ